MNCMGRTGLKRATGLRSSASGCEMVRVGRREPPDEEHRVSGKKCSRKAWHVLVAVMTLLLGREGWAAAVPLEKTPAPEAPPVPVRYVTDKAGVLSPAVRDRLEAQLKNFEAETSNQFIVYTEPQIPEGLKLEEYTLVCARAWRIGQKGHSNGVILFVFPLSRAVRFEVGYGLERVMPDALAVRILQKEVLPRLAKRDFDGGVTAGVQAVIAATRGSLKAAAAHTRAGCSTPVDLVWVPYCAYPERLPFTRDECLLRRRMLNTDQRAEWFPRF
jgi:uncharacterized membrane protein YgcG